MKSATRDRQKVQLNKWISREIKSHNRKRSNSRITTSPKFSYKFDNKSKEGKIILCYSVPKPEPTARKGWRLKQKQLYKKNSNISNYKETIRVFDDFEFVKDENQLAHDTLNVDESGLKFWIEKYCNGQPRYGTEKPSQKTIENDRHMLYQYHDWLFKNKPKHLNIWSHTRDGRKVLIEYLTQQKQSNTWGDSTIHSCYRKCRALFNWIHSQEQSFPNKLLSEMKEIKKPDTIMSSFSEVEFQKILDFMDDVTNGDCSDDIDKKYSWFIPMFRLMLVTGVRVSECVNMKINDLSFDTNRHIDKETGELVEHEVIRWNILGKGRGGGKERMIYIDSKTLIDEIMSKIQTEEGRFRTDKEYVFHRAFWKENKNQHKVTTGFSWVETLHKPFSISGVEHKMKKMVKHLKISENLTPHSCRRFFISHMLKLTEGNVPFVSQLVGHESWVMVNRYARNNQREEMLKGIRNTLNVSEVIRR